MLWYVNLDEASNFDAVPHATNYVSSPGGTIDVAAPRVDILTTLGDSIETQYPYHLTARALLHR